MTTPHDIAGPPGGIAVAPWGGDASDTFVMVYSDVLDALTGRGQLLSVYMALRRKMTPDRMDWWGTRQDMADLAGVSVRTWDRAVKELEEMGLVRSRPRFVPKVWRGDLSEVSPRRSTSHPVQISNVWELRVHLPEYYARRSLDTPQPGEATRGPAARQEALPARPEQESTPEAPRVPETRTRAPEEPFTEHPTTGGGMYRQPGEEMYRKPGELVQAEHNGAIFMIRSSGYLEQDLRKIDEYKWQKDREAEERRQFELAAAARAEWWEREGEATLPPQGPPG